MPSPYVLHHLFHHALRGRKHLDHGKHQGRHQELDEADLGEGTVDLLAVVQRLHWHPKALLRVALQEELFQHLACPNLADAEGLHGVGDVRHVEHQFRKELAGLGLTEAIYGLFRWPTLWVVLEDFTTSIQNFRVHLVDHLDLLYHCKVLRVVGVEDRVYANLAHFQELRLRQHGKDVARWRAHKLEKFGAMHVLQGGLVVVAQRQLVGRFDQEGVVQTRVTDVVAHCAHKQRITLTAAEKGIRAANLQEAVDAVHDVDGMKPVVVRTALLVAGFCALEEAGHHDRIERGTVVVRAHKVHGRGVVPCLVQLQRVQVPRVEKLQRKAGVLKHCPLSIHHVFVVLVLLRILVALPRLPSSTGLLACMALEAVYHGFVTLPQALQGLRVHN
mmetsp:Transcript_67978/g.157773  ORF Transcript_67978/g.157773 Transcript_67978/m.157773 type:complete len:388 (+) Transcript_67978:247-1410(+)